jgi:hypothetical protein
MAQKPWIRLGNQHVLPAEVPPVVPYALMLAYCRSFAANIMR